jgi:zinc protease
MSAKEIDESKRYLIGSIPRQLETNAGIAGFLLSAEFHALGAGYDSELPGLIEGVTREQVVAAAARLIEPARAVIVVAGPWEGPATADAVVMSASEASAAAVMARANRRR